MVLREPVSYVQLLLFLWARLVRTCWEVLVTARLLSSRHLLELMSWDRSREKSLLRALWGSLLANGLKVVWSSVMHTTEPRWSSSSSMLALQIGSSCLTLCWTLFMKGSVPYLLRSGVCYACWINYVSIRWCHWCSLLCYCYGECGCGYRRAYRMRLCSRVTLL